MKKSDNKDDDAPRGSFTIYQNGVVVAKGSGPLDVLRREADHYAAMYWKDGNVRVVVRKSRK